MTQATDESWWVPFEIGVASEKNRFLSTYGQRMKLPSFLENWPHVHNHDQLHTWCDEIKGKKNRYSPSAIEGILESAGLTVENYSAEMKSLTEKFPGS